MYIHQTHTHTHTSESGVVVYICRLVKILGKNSKFFEVEHSVCVSVRVLHTQVRVTTGACIVGLFREVSRERGDENATLESYDGAKPK